MITIKEIANIVGVSPTTVSNVIRGKKKEVSQELAEKIQEVVKMHNYIPHRSAVNLAKNNSQVIAFVMNAALMTYSNVGQDYFTAELIGGLEKAVRENGYFLMIHISEDMEEIETFVNSWNIDGIIALGFSHDRAKALRKAYMNPIIFIDACFDDTDELLINVGLEDYQGAYDMTKLILEYGHREIAYLAVNYQGVDEQRYLGFRDAVKEAGLPETSGRRIIIEQSPSGVRKCIDGLKDDFDTLSALFFGSDHFAIEAMGYLIDMGLSIPQDISVVGFDDSATAVMVRPKLTTVRQSTTEKAHLALGKLVQLIEGKKAVHSQRLSCEPVIRESLGRRH